MSNDQIQRAHLGAGMTASESVGGTQLARGGETAAIAVAEAAKANVLARFQIARMAPRSTMSARNAILAECDRPRFADAATYELPRGGKTITGPTIRFAEACARAWGNITIESPVTFEDADKRILAVSVTDLESNTTYGPTGVVVEKTVERRFAKDAGDVVGTRTNSTGQLIYIVRANDSDLLAKHNALVSKAIRTLILRVIPGDIVEEALERAADVVARGITADPKAAIKKLADAFAALNIGPAQIEEALGHKLEASTPAEINRLRGWYASLRDGEISIGDLIRDTKKKDEATPDGPGDAASSTAASKVSRAAKATAAKAVETTAAQTTIASAPTQPAPAAKPDESDEDRARRIDRGEEG